MMSSVQIRKAVVTDVDQLASLAHELNLFHDDDTRPSPDLLRQHWGKYESFVAVAQEHELVGYIAGHATYEFHTATPGYKIQNMAVTRGHRRSGVGRALMYWVVFEKYETGIRNFSLGVEDGNDTALAFYRSMGFVDRDCGAFKSCSLRGEALEAVVREIRSKM